VELWLGDERVKVQETADHVQLLCDQEMRVRPRIAALAARLDRDESVALLNSRLHCCGVDESGVLRGHRAAPDVRDHRSVAADGLTHA
jgi:hypothetical protein